MPQYPEFLRLCTAYLHQDFDLEFGTPDEALLRFRKDVGEEGVDALNAEIDKLLDHPDDVLTKLILEDFESQYFFPLDWDSAASWLQHIKTLIGTPRS